VRNSQAAVDYVHLKAQAADDLDVMREVLELFLVHTEQVLEGLEATRRRPHLEGTDPHAQGLGTRCWCLCRG
jgi:hypothetical protein